MGEIWGCRLAESSAFVGQPFEPDLGHSSVGRKSDTAYPQEQERVRPFFWPFSILTGGNCNGANKITN